MGDKRLHARLGASKAARWRACPGSVRMSEGLPDIDTPYAQEGRAAHALGEIALKGGHYDQPTIDIGTAEPWKIDDEMIEGVRMYTDYFEKQMRGKPFDVPGSGYKLYVEQTFSFERWNPPEPMFGTADGVIVSPKLLEVVDFKYGTGVVVEANNNDQLLYYLAGAIESFAADYGVPFSQYLAMLEKQGVELRVTVIQPRAPHADGPIRTSDVTYQELRTFVEGLLADAEATQLPNAGLNAGDWCRFCPARGHCPALQKRSMELAQIAFADVPIQRPPNPEHLSLAVVGEILNDVHILQEWINALKERARLAMEQGEVVPGWKLVQKRATLKWVDEAAVRDAASQQGLSADEWNEPPMLKSPAQLKKLMVVDPALYEKVSSGVKIAPESDRKPAVVMGIPALPGAQQPAEEK